MPKTLRGPGGLPCAELERRPRRFLRGRGPRRGRDRRHLTYRGVAIQTGRYAEFSPLHRLTRVPDLGALTNTKASFEMLTTHRLPDTIPLAWRSKKLSGLGLRDL